MRERAHIAGINSRGVPFFLLLCAAFSSARAALLPTADGTTWRYELTVSSEGEPTHSNMLVQIHGRDSSKGRELLRFDTLMNDELQQKQLLEVSDAGLLRYERTSRDGMATPFDPPQNILPAPLKVGAKWEFDDVIAGSEMHVAFAIAGEEEMEVPAGKFRAFHLHCEQPWPMSIKIDRWFTPGTGLVKEIVETRGPTGRLLNRSTLQLMQLSVEEIKGASPTPAPNPPQIKLEVAKERDGSHVTEFRSDAPNIYVRWSGQNLPINDEVRIVWVAEDVGDVADPNFVVDEVTAVITRPDYSARFTLSRPKDGWAPGKYRVEIFLEDKLMQSVAVTIRE